MSGGRKLVSGGHKKVSTLAQNSNFVPFSEIFSGRHRSACTEFVLLATSSCDTFSRLPCVVGESSTIGNVTLLACLLVRLFY